MSLDSILRATGKNLFDCGKNSDYNFPIQQFNLTISNNTMSGVVLGTGNSGIVNTKHYISSGTYTFSSIISGTDTPNYRYLVRPYNSNHQIITNLTISGWTYNQWYKAYIPNSSAQVKTFTIPDTVSYWQYGLAFLGTTGETVTYSNIQLEEGSTATTYEPYEYLGPKIINLGSGSSSKEVLKVSYNSKNFFNINNIYNPLNTDTYEISNNTLKVYRNRSYIVGVIYHISLPVGTQYTVHYDIEYGGTATGVYNCADDKIFQGRLNHVNYTGTIGDTGYLKLEFSRIGGDNDKLGWVTYSNIQLELGNKKTEYVPYFNTVVWTKKA